MTDTLELPGDLHDDMTVLFVNPYSPQESEELKRAGNATSVLKNIFARAQSRDPDFETFIETLAVVKTYYGLKGYIVGDDLIILYGDQEKLGKAQNDLKQKYTCFFDTIGAFMAHTEDKQNIVRVTQEKPLLN